jgi:hypothetical protein
MGVTREKFYECVCDLCGSHRRVDDGWVAENIMVKVYVPEKNKTFYVCQLCSRSIHKSVPEMPWYKPEQ